MAEVSILGSSQDALLYQKAYNDKKLVSMTEEINA